VENLNRSIEIISLLLNKFAMHLKEGRIQENLRSLIKKDF
jgi:hypothetical protein